MLLPEVPQHVTEDVQRAHQPASVLGLARGGDALLEQRARRREAAPIPGE
jgi:hypothetical protein